MTEPDEADELMRQLQDTAPPTIPKPSKANPLNNFRPYFHCSACSLPLIIGEMLVDEDDQEGEEWKKQEAPGEPSKAILYICPVCEYTAVVDEGSEPPSWVVKPDEPSKLKGK